MLAPSATSGIAIAPAAAHGENMNLSIGLQGASSLTTNMVPKWTTAAPPRLINSMIFDNGTNVGIGTIAPSHELDVTAATLWSEIIVRGPSGGALYFDNDAGSPLLGEINASPTGGMRFYTQDTLRMTVTTAGNVGIGLTNPTAKFEVAASLAGDYLARINNTSGAGSGGRGLFVRGDNRGLEATGQNAIVASGQVGINVTGSNNAGIFNGDVLIDDCLQVVGWATVGSCSSDVRLKQDIQPLPRVLDKLVLLNPVSFHWRPGMGPSPKVFADDAQREKWQKLDAERQVGLIAQEVERIFPHLVTTDPKTGYKKVGYGLELELMTIQAVKEQQEEIQALKREIEDLKRQMNGIKGR